MSISISPASQSVWEGGIGNTTTVYFNINVTGVPVRGLVFILAARLRPNALPKDRQQAN